MKAFKIDFDDVFVSADEKYQQIQIATSLYDIGALRFSTISAVEPLRFLTFLMTWDIEFVRVCSFRLLGEISRADDEFPLGNMWPLVPLLPGWGGKSKATDLPDDPLCGDRMAYWETERAGFE